jgi:hypothetical protein
MIRARRLVAAAAAATAILALSACSDQTAGSAALLGDTRITDQQLTAQVEDVLVAKGQPATSSDQNLVQQTLGRMITIELVDRLAAREGVSVTQGQIDEQVANYTGQAGSEQAMQDLFIQENVAPSQVEAFVKLQIQAQDLGIKLDPHGSAEEQGAAVFEAASALSVDLDTTVSPRYGTWDPASLAVGAVPSDLSTPPALG